MNLFTDQLVQSLDNGWEARSVSALLLPAVEHQLMDRFRTIHRRGKTVVLLNGLDHISAQDMTSHMTIPKLQTSDADMNFRNAIASGAVHRTGIFPPRVV